ncbi:MAG: hypothetical protein HY617_01410 [Candidatus Sungbacteria bacterium]|nr:hypothetical protein [Candidatus Sungbacteria bacterium]
MIRWLIRYSRGHVRTERQAKRVLWIVALVLFALDAALLTHAFKGKIFTFREEASAIPEQYKIHHVHPHQELPPGTFIITMTPKGFEPDHVAIAEGASVTFVNEDVRERWPASDSHPAHMDYPIDYLPHTVSYYGSHACVGPLHPKAGAFDPCGPILSEGFWSFVFQKKGAWQYHDHLYPNLTGVIIVD